MRFALCQINPTVGALEANSQKILKWVDMAPKKGAGIAVFSEGSLCGYSPQDLFEDKKFFGHSF